MSSSADHEKAKKAAAEKEKEKKEKKKAEEELKAARKKYMDKANPKTVDQLLGEKDLEKDYFKEGEWRPSWAYVEFNGDACLADVLEKKVEGFYVPAGTMLPLGAQMFEMTVVKYGGYFPEGTSFPGGVMVPMHARMVNLLPKETKKGAAKMEESLCLVQ
ncbi:hypothetical protein L198_02115 [Cryptococcus wingfieldii CBS 7118]|uniref:Uncharacterized protein n=1 Tax=Cryptococcus wingfieldii CBS 7118 TaxID=1295528 RepID=A0A1E3JZU3_9TREE|nr:hypothetical protein L198_02115 [Cryptococcus wingfieldii CBS 7118]ODO05422.1 hypothetical protein L198_02115 [Cryptococcus wingfieldii CBS 7118]